MSNLSHLASPRKILESWKFEELMEVISDQPNSASTHLQALESDGSSVEQTLEEVLKKGRSKSAVAR